MHGVHKMQYAAATWHQYKVFRTKICLLSKMSGSMSFSTGLSASNLAETYRTEPYCFRIIKTTPK